MKTINRNIVGKWSWLLLAGLLAQSGPAATKPEETFPVLKTRSGTYTNVTVTKKTRDWIFIIHSQGMGNIKIPDLALEAQQRLGYAPIPQKSPTRNGAPSGPATLASTGGSPANTLRQAWEQFAPGRFPVIAASPAFGFAVLGTLVAGYFFFCYCSLLICAKAGVEPGLLIWLPVLQILPLLQAAKMSRWWFFAFFVPLLNLGVQILWSLNIVKVRGKSFWLGLLLALPITNLLAFLYLAFSRTTPVETERPPEIMTLEAA